MIRKASLYEKVLAHDYHPSKHQLVGDANVLNGRKMWYERRESEVPEYLKTAYKKAMNLLNGAKLELSSDPAEKRKKSYERRKNKE